MKKILTPFFEDQEEGWVDKDQKSSMELCCGNGRNTIDLLFPYFFDDHYGLDFDDPVTIKFKQAVAKKLKPGKNPNIYIYTDSISNWAKGPQVYDKGFAVILGNWALEYLELWELEAFFK